MLIMPFKKKLRHFLQHHSVEGIVLVRTVSCVLSGRFEEMHKP